jgi:hypothetical protein
MSPLHLPMRHKNLKFGWWFLTMLYQFQRLYYRRMISEHYICSIINGSQPPTPIQWTEGQINIRKKPGRPVVALTPNMSCSVLRIITCFLPLTTIVLSIFARAYVCNDVIWGAVQPEPHSPSGGRITNILNEIFRRVRNLYDLLWNGC